LRISIAAPGKLKHPGAIAYADDYMKRIQRIMPVHRVPVRSPRRRHGGFDRAARSAEADNLLRSIPAGSVVCALDVEGRVFDSHSFLLWLVGLIESGTRDLVFVIGGPDGLEHHVIEASNYRVSLGPLVLPHDMAEVVLLEQIYRALTRWKGFPYHR
jgi:23S rRNA (pseudouridine1915-N3)-methyltransferase